MLRKVIALHITQNQTVSPVVRIPAVLTLVARITLAPRMNSVMHLRSRVLKTISLHKIAHAVPNVSLNKYCFSDPEGAYCLLHFSTISPSRGMLVYFAEIKRFYPFCRRSFSLFELGTPTPFSALYYFHLKRIWGSTPQVRRFICL